MRAWIRLVGPTLASLLLVLVLALCFYTTALSTALARIEALRTVEPYAFAVHLQLLRNFALEGEFFQTIHRGYDNAWTWSGHRSLTFVLSGLLLKLDPSALGLSRIQVLAVAAGCLPAADLGRRALRSNWGLALGGCLYLLAPATMVMALQDYQDLVFALPCLMTTLWAMRTRKLALVLVGCILGCLPREETVPLVLASALVTLPRGGLTPFWSWLRNVLLAAFVVLAWTLLLSAFFPMGASGGHDTPLLGALDGLRDAGLQIQLPGLPQLGGFYSLLWAPLGLPLLFSPLVLLPGLATLLMHLTVPFGHGVDRFWSGHVHHLAPCLPFFILATIEGTSRILLFLRARLRWGSALAFIFGLCILLYALQWDLQWARHFNLILGSSAPSWRHPAWELVELLPPDAVPVVPTQASLSVADRARSYTYNESLFDKAPEQGLAAASHLIVDDLDTRVLAWGMAMPGARLVSSQRGFSLITWEPGVPDPSWNELRALGEIRKRDELAGPRDLPGVPRPMF